MSSEYHQQRQALKQAQRIVVKVGTHVLVNQHGQPCHQRIANLAANLARLNQQGKEVVLVSSGAIATGIHALRWSQRPTDLPSLQMAAAVGQTHLLEIYQRCFSEQHALISQVLLTHDDLRHRKRHLNARNTLNALLQHRVIPIINENDVIAVDEIKVGDNDVLSSLVAILVNADLLILLTSPDGLQQNITGQPSPSQRIPYLTTIDQQVLGLAQGKSSTLSTGGMATKLQAAKRAGQTGCKVVIASGLQDNIIAAVVNGDDVGTLIQLDSSARSPSRKHWLGYFNRPQGSLVIDHGAETALLQRGTSLLAAGITATNGHFSQGAMVNICNQQQQVLGQGIVNYSAQDIERIKGQHSSAIQPILGYRDYEEVIHRNNLVITHE